MARKPDKSPKAVENGASRKTSQRRSRPGTLIAIGGREDKENGRLILREVAARAGTGKLVVATFASDVPDEQWYTYKHTFAALGVKNTVQLDYKRREDAVSNPKLDILDDAAAVFFTGGDQLKLTSKIAGTETLRRILELYRSGVTIAGTSAGAAALSKTMLVGGRALETHKVASAFFTATGLGLLRDVIIDQHFAQRTRVGRLLGVVAENPGMLGIGIDEDTAVLFDRDKSFEVIGSGAVYVIDGSGITYTNVSEQAMERTMALFNVKLHVLKAGNASDLAARTPSVISDSSESCALSTSNVEEDALQDTSA